MLNPRSSKKLRPIALALAAFLCLLLPATAGAEDREPKEPAAEPYERLQFDRKIDSVWEMIGKNGLASELTSGDLEIGDISLVARDGFVAVEYLDSSNGSLPLSYLQYKEDARPLERISDFAGLKSGYECGGKMDLITVDDIELVETAAGGMAVSRLVGTKENGEVIRVEQADSAPLCLTKSFDTRCHNVLNQCAPLPKRCWVRMHPGPPQHIVCECWGGLDNCILILTFTCKDNGCEAIGGTCLGDSVLGDGQVKPDPLPDDVCACTFPDGDGGGDDGDGGGNGDAEGEGR